MLQAALTGSRSALVVLGVTNNPLWGLGLVLGILSIVKFDWIYFLAGRLWGRGLIELMGGPLEARRQERRPGRAAGPPLGRAGGADHLPADPDPGRGHLRDGGAWPA